MFTTLGDYCFFYPANFNGDHAQDDNGLWHPMYYGNLHTYVEKDGQTWIVVID